MNTIAEIMQPIAALAAWTMVMWVWMYVTRIPAMSAAKIDADELVRQGGQSLDQLLPAKMQWKAHNYNHLHEAPTVFYAVALALALIGQGDGLNATLAWAYVGLRIVHSLVQSTINKVMVRFLIFALSSLVLMALTLHLVLAVF
ncbi:MAG: MAPEG family protein [Sphingomonadaceae bacterium]|nr:MAPEG family protein [Sphingomonadaceae bacterium]